MRLHDFCHILVGVAARHTGERQYVSWDSSILEIIMPLGFPCQKHSAPLVLQQAIPETNSIASSNFS